MEEASSEDADAAFAQAEQELRAAMRAGPAWHASDRARKQQRRFPDFLVVGAQKAGTTWLYRNLNFHPEIWLPPVKEINYFNEVYLPSSDGWESRDRVAQAEDARNFLSSLATPAARQRTKLESVATILRNERTDDWYGEIFSRAGDDMVCGEISPDYALLPRVAISRILAQNPMTKVVFVMRDPIARAWSNARMTFSRGDEEGLASFFNDPMHWPVIQGRSNYPAILKRWSALTPSANMIVMSFDEIVGAPFIFLERLCERIGVGFDKRFFPEVSQVVREGATDEIPTATLGVMRERMRPIYDRLMQIAPDIASPWANRHYGRQ